VISEWDFREISYPPTTAMGQDAAMPVKSLKITKAAKLGARAQARVKMVKMEKAPIITRFRPYCCIAD
jgi:hypothetical protein